MEQNKESFRELREELLTSLSPIIEAVKKLHEAENLTKEDAEWLAQMEQKLREILPYIQKISGVLSEKVYGTALAYYYSVKEHAEKGDIRAQAIFDDLKPLFKDSLSEQIDLN
jgi:methylthioribose-1-phosphate isomerase